MGTFEALGWERVAVPAGTFTAMRIFHYGSGYWLEYWYAPAVQWYVRLSYKEGSYELLSYRRTSDPSK